ncbi:hypothetical protein SDRG_07239 [Saprolegnia diclina VS20]|uniref:AGC protein kinase n=1 Tax=Saprolegnia diclina (strain VS20) TaxID=1156394 RepID=T0RXH2_SAPDV|nr:hypothetical protein SDRG_07239 [Saprolegnia diclina VS20]EQC34997.1 hypothetical protein SDRG_07239 [Saprolegnia diclina VS20]|eukprot:XP_008611281.1 hypothetical protein SDRG_07239 [Saprolegnia diclina VS20]
MPASEPESVLYELAAALRKGVAIRTRRLGLRSHKLTFLGSDAVTWLVENAACRSRDDAIELGRNLHHAGLFRPIVGSDPFRDDKNTLYRFAEDDVGDDELSGSKSVSVKPSDGVKPLVERLTGRRTSVPTKGIRSLLLKKKAFCPIESLLTVAPGTTFGFEDGCPFFFPAHTVHNSIALTLPVVETMKKAFASHDMRARENAVYGLRKEVLKAADSSDKNWMYIKNVQGHHGNDVRVFYRDAVGGFHTFLTVGAIHVPPATFVEHFLDHEERAKMEAFYEAGQTVEDLLMAHTREMKVKHHIHQPFWDAKAPWSPDQSMHSISGDIADVTAHHMKPAEKYPQVAPGTIVEEPTQQQLIGGGTQRILYRTMSSVSRVVSKRDFVTFQDSFSMANGGHVVYEISVQHRDIPTSLPSYTRGEVLCLAHIAEPIDGLPTACMLTVVTQVGFKGKMPEFVAKMIFDKLITRSFESQMCDRVTDNTEIMAGAFANVPYITDDSQTDDFESRATLLDFEILAVLGRGGFGKVLQVRHRKTQKVHAMKVLKKENIVHDIQVERTRTERSILAAVEHPFIVAKEYSMEYMPHIASDDDVSNFMDQFTQETVTDSTATTSYNSSSQHSSNASSWQPQSSTEKSGSNFSGFSFVGAAAFNESGF